MRGMVKQLGHIFKFPAEFRNHCVINTQKYRLRPQVFVDQVQRNPCCGIHESGIINFGIGTHIIESVQRFFCNSV